MNEAASTLNLEEFRSALSSGNDEALDAIIEEAAGMMGPEQTDVLAQMLMACVKHRGNKADCVERLLELGADPTGIVQEGERDLSGMRFHMKVSHVTPLAQAIDDGRSVLVSLCLRQCNVGLVSDDSLVHIPDVAVLYTAKDPQGAYPFNAFAFAIACGQTEIFRSMLSAADRDRDTVREAMGRALDDVLESGLLDQAPDSVLGDVVTLIGHGAPLSDFARTTLATMLIRLDNGWDLASPQDPRTLSFAAMATLSTTPLAKASAADAVTTLSRLKAECDVDLLAPASPDFPGATLLHYAAVAGHSGVISLLLEYGANPAAPDGAGRSSTYYAKAARHQVAQNLFMSECYLNLADDPSTNFGIGELPLQRDDQAVLPVAAAVTDEILGELTGAPSANTGLTGPRAAPAQSEAPQAPPATPRDAFNRLRGRQAAAAGKRPDEMPVVHAKPRKKAGFASKQKTA